MDQREIQARKNRRRRRRRRQVMIRRAIVIAVPVLLIVLLLMLVVSCTRRSDKPGDVPVTEATAATEADTGPVQRTRTASAELLAMGDVLMHKPVIYAYQDRYGGFDFDPMFRYIRSMVLDADYAVANLETTLCGQSNGYDYSGYPSFNCPDDIADGLRRAGFDGLLTANNHCYDTSHVGLLRTIETARVRSLDVLGTREDPAAARYLVKDLNGIRIGMVCYTYEMCLGNREPGKAYLNGAVLKEGDESRVNTFDPDDLEPFYQKLSEDLAGMREQGAQATVVFIHWGEEYQLMPNQNQKTIAQRLCDMGVDVIIGGHPHVVQPAELLSSTADPEHKTVCVYSMGNAVSNQRAEQMDMNTGHTEDGLIVRVTFAAYSDGTVCVDDLTLVPTWVDMRTRNGSKTYDILPLVSSEQDQWSTTLELSEQDLSKAASSLARTQNVLGSGVDTIRQYLTQQREQLLQS